MNATRTSTLLSRTVLLANCAALAAQLAGWGLPAAHVGLGTAFTQSHQGVAAELIIGSTLWLVQFAVITAALTIKRVRSTRLPAVTAH